MYKPVKRFLDVLFSLVGIIIFFPFFIPLAIMLLLTGEHYIWYRQERIGYRNRKFKIWKFATMLKASPSLGTGSITLKNDWRLTPMGKYLRGSKVNEIPQLINILIGDMSIVGPRPLMQVDFNKFSDDIKTKFYNCKPGLTGIASLVFCDEQKLFSESKLDPHEFDRLYIAPYKAQLENWYQQHCSLYADSMIIIITAWSVFYPGTSIQYKVFDDLPRLPEQLKCKFDNQIYS